MVRILLADDSPHAQRMGERILREEGYEVVSIADGNAALERLPAFDPDVIVADIHMPYQSGYEICRRAKASNQHVRVILTAGLLEPVDDGEVVSCGSDALLKKPFEATAVLNTIRPLIAQAHLARGLAVDEGKSKPAARSTSGSSGAAAKPARIAQPASPAPLLVSPPPLPGTASAAADAAPATPLNSVSTVDRERIEAAVVLALERSMPTLIKELTERVITALNQK